MPPLLRAQILVVMDREGESMASELAAAGHEARRATGVEAVAAFASSPFDLVVVDPENLVMPRRLRPLTRGQAVPMVLALKAAQLDPRLLDETTHWIDDVLVRPTHPVELALRVRSLVSGGRRARDWRRGQELAGFIVHDLRNPLTSLLATTQYLLRQEGEEAMRQVLRDTEAAGELMQRMLANLLDVQRAADGRLRPLWAEVDLVALARDVVRSVRHRAAERELQVILDERQPITPLLVRADRDLLARAVGSLLDNSLRYAPTTSVIHVGVARDGARLRLSVRDAGPRVPLEQRELLFDPFAPLSTDNSLRVGRASSMPFSRLVADAHQGKVWVEDADPTGTAFHLELPT